LICFFPLITILNETVNSLEYLSLAVVPSGCCDIFTYLMILFFEMMPFSPLWIIKNIIGFSMLDEMI